MAAGAGMTLAQIDLERPGHDVCAQDVVGVALVALNGVTLDHARPVGKRERLEFDVGTASAVNPVAPAPSTSLRLRFLIRSFRGRSR